MKKLFQIIVLAGFFLIPLLAQESLTPAQARQKLLDENGIPGDVSSSLAYDSPVSVQWTSLTNATEPFGRSIGGKIGDFIYIFGGQANSSLAIAYQVSTGAWIASTVPTSPAYNASFCVADGELYKLSGTGSASVFEKFTPDGSGTGTWTVLIGGPSNVMNSQSTMAWDGGDYIYVHSSGYTSPYQSYLARYSISGNSWVSLTPTTLIKRYAGLQFYDGYLYLIGGLVPTGDDMTLCAKYDPGTDTWSAIAPLPEAVNFCKWSTTQVPDYIVLVGSGGGYSTYPSNPKIFYYDPIADNWTYDSDTPAERGLALGFFVPDVNVLFFGGGNTGGSSTNYQSDCWYGEASFIPVELTSFTAKVNGNNVVLNWTTATETNNKGFEIERSQNPVINNQTEWETAGFVPGHGTTTKSAAYTFEESGLSTGSYYYRLKQIDFDGSFEYSNVVNVNIDVPDKFLLSQNYPNPFNPSTTIEFTIPENGFVRLSVFNSLGQEVSVPVNKNMISGHHIVNITADNLSSGIYYYRLEMGNNVNIKKMMVLK